MKPTTAAADAQAATARAVEALAQAERRDAPAVEIERLRKAVVRAYDAQISLGDREAESVAAVATSAHLDMVRKP
jgi:hypothetical protein